MILNNENFSNVLQPKNNPFDPDKELKAIKALSRNERKEKISEYKENLINQKKGIASIIGEINEAIHQDSSMSYEELFEIVSKNSSSYRLTDEQINNFSEGLKKYQEKHSVVEKYKDLAINDSDLFKKCFGVEPENDIEVTYNPVSINFTCSNPSDYANACYHNVKKTDTNDPAINDTVMSMLKVLRENTSNGMSLRNVRITDKKELNSTLEHEEQHKLNRLFQPQTPREKMRFPTKDTSLEAVSNKIIGYSRELCGIDARVRDEVLAHIKDGRSPKDIFKRISEFNSYDYPKIYQELIKNIPEVIQNTFKESHIQVGWNYSATINHEEAKKFVDNYFEKEYKKDLKKWIDAITVLEDKSYSKDEIVNLLYGYPIVEWPSIARRM